MIHIKIKGQKHTTLKQNVKTRKKKKLVQKRKRRHFKKNAKEGNENSKKK